MDPAPVAGETEYRAVIGCGGFGYRVRAIVEDEQAPVQAHHEHGMVRAADKITDNHEEQLVLRKAGRAQKLQLGQGIIFAVAASTTDGLGQTRP